MMLGRTIRIDPASRLEGEAEIKIIIDDEGRVQNVYFQVVEFRGFERFCIGRPIEELPRIVTRICGVCPWAHHMASGKAVDMVYGRDPPPAAKLLRELGYCAHILDSHTIHLFVLALPDFLLPNADRKTRNILGLYRKNPDLVKRVLKVRSLITRIEETIGGKAIHPVVCIPGGITKGISGSERSTLRDLTEEIYSFSIDVSEIIFELVEKDNIRGIIEESDTMRTYYAGVVDDNNKLNFYDGRVRIVDPHGKEKYKFEAKDYLKYIAEKSVPWSYTKMPYLREIGWNGLEDGETSGIFRVGPLARLNVTEGLSTPKAQEYYERFIELFGKPAHNTMAYHFARLVEMVYASERILELLDNDDIVGDDLVNTDGEFSGFGVGIVEAPRGLLIHHYEADKEGFATRVNLIIPTTMNNPSINIDMLRVASKYDFSEKISEPILNRIEMVYRAYDPCLACSTHSIGGHPLRFKFVKSDGKLIRVIGEYV